MLKVDFSKIKIHFTFEGEPTEVDLRKELANAIHQTTNDIGFDDFARNLYYSDGDIEVPSDYIQKIMDIASKKYIVPVQIALKQLLKDE